MHDLRHGGNIRASTLVLGNMFSERTVDASRSLLRMSKRVCHICRNKDDQIIRNSEWQPITSQYRGSI